MSETSTTTPVWTPPAKIEEIFSKTAGNQFAAINAPTAGARAQAELPRGFAPIQLYSLGTPNGIKVSILLEELDELGLTQYDAHVINIGKGDQFGSGFVAGNPNSKIPMAMDYGVDGDPIRIFESASIVMYFAEKFGRFIPSDPRQRVEMNNWVFWQMSGQGPITGNFGHFFVYAPSDKVEARDYGVARYGMDTLRLTDVLEKHLEDKQYMLGDEYSVVDMICFPWFHQLRTGYIHSSGVAAKDFLSVTEKFKNVNAWADRILERPAVKRGIQVCDYRTMKAKPWLETAEVHK